MNHLGSVISDDATIVRLKNIDDAEQKRLDDRLAALRERLKTITDPTAVPWHDLGEWLQIHQPSAEALLEALQEVRRLEADYFTEIGTEREELRTRPPQPVSPHSGTAPEDRRTPAAWRWSRRGLLGDEEQAFGYHERTWERQRPDQSWELFQGAPLDLEKFTRDGWRVIRAVPAFDRWTEVVLRELERLYRSGDIPAVIAELRDRHRDARRKVYDLTKKWKQLRGVAAIDDRERPKLEKITAELRDAEGEVEDLRERLAYFGASYLAV